MDQDERQRRELGRKRRSVRHKLRTDCRLNRRPRAARNNAPKRDRRSWVAYSRLRRRRSTANRRRGAS